MAYRRILVVRTSAVGDFVTTLPVVRALRRAAPRAHLRLLGKPETLSLAIGEADAIDSIDLAMWAAFFVPGSALHAAGEERIRDTDLVVCYLPDADGVFAANLRRAGAGRVVCHPPHPPADGSLHIVDHLAAPLAMLSIPCTDRVPHVALTQEDEEAADHILRAHGLERGEPVAVHPGSGSLRKCWSPKRFAAVAGRVSGDLGRRAMLLSGPADGDLARRVERASRARLTVVPRLPLRHLAALLSASAAYLGNDSGPSHLAAAVGTPTTVLFGPTDPRVWAPRGEAVQVIEGDPERPPGKRLESLCEDRVFAALAASLRQGALYSSAARH